VGINSLLVLLRSSSIPSRQATSIDVCKRRNATEPLLPKSQPSKEGGGSDIIKQIV